MIIRKNPITIADKASIIYEQNLGSDVSGNKQDNPMVITNDEMNESDDVTNNISLGPNYVSLSPESVLKSEIVVQELTRRATKNLFMSSSGQYKNNNYNETTSMIRKICQDSVDKDIH